MSAISLLKKEVYELIAAGEVIDRPASVIKELLENAVDAGATSVTVEIKNGGRTFMRVTDNGSGIPFDQVPTAFLRHATSKVAEKADLEKISTLGFRGEALASICAVSKTEVLTKTHDSQLGTRYVISGGEQLEYEAAGCPDGTSVIVRDLFYNVPARLKFLKKDATEANRIQDLMGKLAVSHPEISVKLIKDNAQVFVTAGDGKLYTAVYSVFGREFAKSMLEADYASEGVSVRGFVSKPLTSKNNRKFQIFYVNDRYIRSEVCSQALEEAYRNSIMVGRFPACVLNIHIDPDMIDVNVHPAKTEIRFSDNRFVYNAVYFAVKQALTEKDVPTRMTFDKRRNFDPEKLYVEPEESKAVQMAFAPPRTERVEKAEKPVREHTDDLFLSSLESPAPQDNAQKPLWSGELPPAAPEEAPAEKAEDSNDPYDDDAFFRLCENYNASCAGDGEAKAKTEPEPAEDTEQDNVADIADIEPKDTDLPQNYGEDTEAESSGLSEDFMFVKTSDFEKRYDVPQPAEELPEPEKKPVVVGELFKTYIVAQRGDEMLLIDKHAAHERYIFENIKSDSRNLSSQTLLEPIMVMLSYDEYDALAANTDKAAKLGFIIEPDVAPTVAVLGLPMLLRDENPTDIVTEIAHKLLMNERDPAPELYDDLYHTMACKAAIKAHDDSSIQELQKLVDSIVDCDIRYCPHGRPVMITMPKREIEKQFKRIV